MNDPAIMAGINLVAARSSRLAVGIEMVIMPPAPVNQSLEPRPVPLEICNYSTFDRPPKSYRQKAPQPFYAAVSKAKGDYGRRISHRSGR